MKKKKILLVGGGTGGHIFPMRNLADELQKLGADVEILVSDSPLDRKIVAENFSDLPAHFLKTEKIRRYFSFLNVLAPFQILRAVFRAKKILQKSNPDAIFFKGGFVGFPVLIAAKFFLPFHGKIFSHESDISAGALTRMGRNFADQTFESFGHPAFPLFFSAKSETKSSAPNKRPHLLIMGGSQGAEFVNQLFLKSCDKILKKFQTTLVTGPGKKLAMRHSSLEQFEMLPAADLAAKIQTADLIVSRAGANSLFEIIANRKPNLIIPLPSAARNHQAQNARFFERQNLCRIYEQNSKADFFVELEKTLTDKSLLHALKDSKVKNAAPEIAERILKSLKS